MAKSDPVRNLKAQAKENAASEEIPKVDDDGNVTELGDVPAPSGFGTDESAVAKEIASLIKTVSRLGEVVDRLASMEATKRNPGIVRLGYAPEETRLTQIWDLAYGTALQSIYARGLSFYNSKPALLQSEMGRAAIMADTAVEEYIKLRKVAADPVQKELQDWQKVKADNPLVPPPVSLNELRAEAAQPSAYQKDSAGRPIVTSADGPIQTTRSQGPITRPWDGT